MPTKSSVLNITSTLTREKFEAQVDEVIDAAMTVQAENGPDPDYRRAALQDLEKAKKKLIEMVFLI